MTRKTVDWDVENQNKTNNMLAIRAGIHKFSVGIPNREDPDQTASEEAV